MRVCDGGKMEVTLEGSVTRKRGWMCFCRERCSSDMRFNRLYTEEETVFGDCAEKAVFGDCAEEETVFGDWKRLTQYVWEGIVQNKYAA
ncbi:hypothetical protein FCV25MIE_02606 [Fagus crenata]